MRKNYFIYTMIKVLCLILILLFCSCNSLNFDTPKCITETNSNKSKQLLQNAFEAGFKTCPLKSQTHIEIRGYKLANIVLVEAIPKNHIDQLEREYQDDYYRTLYFLKKTEKKYAEALNALEKPISIEPLKLATENKVIANKNLISGQNIYMQIAFISIAVSLLISIFCCNYKKKSKKIDALKWMQKDKDRSLENEKIMMQNQIDERNRIAQELHDDLGSTLTSISMAVELFNLHPNNAVPIQIINQSTNELSIKINEIVWSLNVQNDTLLSLIAYFRKFARNFLGDANIKLSWEQSELIEELKILGYVRRSIFLTLKEILNNIVRHSKATEVAIKVEQENQLLKIMIKDNGVGLTENINTELVNIGNGLSNINSSIAKLGGTVNYFINNGTIITLKIPV